MGRRKGVAREKELRWNGKIEPWEARRGGGQKEGQPNLSARHLFQGWVEAKTGGRSPADQLPNLTERPGRCRAKREVDLFSKASRQVR